MTPPRPFLVLDGLSKCYGATPALKGVDLAVSRGELVALVGPSGCGKTTVLRLVAGLETPDAGHIRLDGRDITAAESAARNIAMVFQDYALYPHLTVFGNIAFPLKVRKTPRNAIRPRVEEVARLLGIADILNRRPSQLSGGQQQRVAIGRALVRRPALFLMDEPLSNLDAPLRLSMRDEIARLHRSTGATILYVTHDPLEALTLADRVVVMEAGAIVQAGTPAEVIARPANAFFTRYLEETAAAVDALRPSSRKNP